MVMGSLLVQAVKGTAHIAKPMASQENGFITQNVMPRLGFANGQCLFHRFDQGAEQSVDAVLDFVDVAKNIAVDLVLPNLAADRF